ncbi:amidohydrolase family protein [Elongatibacter sediminis]|uniref:Amidohydrolase family protein n=1 Tax=Elongatibacter sediminis TaxID=3119006 RepID=A0AAW9R6Q1_9GAMM
MFKTKIAAIFLALALLLPSALPAQEGAEIDLAVVGGRLIDGFGGTPLPNAVILVSGNRIVEVGQVGMVDIPASAAVVDSNGMTVLPGLWESHGHLFHAAEGDPQSFPAKFRERAPAVMAAVAKINLMSGITSFRDTGGPIEQQLQLRADIEAGETVGPRLFLAGPILRQEALDPDGSRGEYYIDSPDSARRVTRKVLGLGVDQIKVYGFWDREILEGVTQTAHEAGIGVDADVRHITAYRTAIEAGVDRLHHVFTADALSDYSDADLRLLIRGLKPAAAGPMANILRGPWILPTIEMRMAYARVLAFPELIDHPSLARQYPPDVYEHLRESWENPSSVPWGIGAPERIKVAKRKLAHFIEAGGREQIVAGTDAGAPFNFHSPLTRELRNLHEAGLTAMETIQAATLRPAQLQGVQEDLGSVSAGKLADMVIVDGDPLRDVSVLQHRIAVVIKDGEVYRPGHGADTD